jgi:hypothetical protein
MTLSTEGRGLFVNDGVWVRPDRATTRREGGRAGLPGFGSWRLNAHRPSAMADGIRRFIHGNGTAMTIAAHPSFHRGLERAFEARA